MEATMQVTSMVYVGGGVAAGIVVCLVAVLLVYRKHILDCFKHDKDVEQRMVPTAPSVSLLLETKPAVHRPLLPSASEDVPPPSYPEAWAGKIMGTNSTLTTVHSPLLPCPPEDVPPPSYPEYYAGQIMETPADRVAQTHPEIYSDVKNQLQPQQVEDSKPTPSLSETNETAV